MKPTFAAAILSLLACHNSQAGVSVAQLQQMLARPGAKPLLIDVRSPAIYQAGSIPGAISIPISVLPEKKLAFKGDVILFDSGVTGETPETLVTGLRENGVSGADWLVGGYAAWSESPDNSTTAEKGAQRVTRATITYEQLTKAKEKICIVDLRSAKNRMVPEGKHCPIEGFCSEKSLDYCPDLTRFHRDAKANRRKRSNEDSPLIVLMDDDAQSAVEAERRLRAEGYQRVAILLGGSEIILHRGRRGLSRTGGVVGEGDSSTLPDNETRPKPNTPARTK